MRGFGGVLSARFNASSRRLAASLAERLTAHRNDVNILAYAELGTLRVTWAAVSAAQQDGVERYLADQYPPLIGDAFPDVEPIAVNSPY